ncbi:hypothetical protein [Intestinibacter bartlettii]|uniref:Uncharacterized protein n=1 Tax=Intestinibacter bartlettii TaxID=261299 RepID=A0ABS6DZM0_9FIRM|nr:hypothetical protein [Intestinibacter bartlettii]MBU5336691.1 hypothetical protein [Intestinibacter bartlettii]
MRGTYTYYTTGENYVNLISGESITQTYKSKPANIEDDFSYFDDDIMSFELIDSSFDEDPVDLNSTHSSLDATPVDLNSTPSSLDATPIDLNSTPSSLDSTPSSFDASPIDLESTHIINPSNNSSITPAKGDDNNFEDLLAELMWNFIKIKNPSFKKPNLQSWAKAFRFILNEDNRSLQEVTDLLKWIYVENTFWSVHVLNPWSLRNKYEDILARKNYEKSKPHRDIYSTCDSLDLSDFEDME